MKKSIFVDFKTIDIERAKKKCLKYKCVSFDVFDTLIKRNVSEPNTIFDILDSYATELGVTKFKVIRLNTENNLRKDNPFVTIDQVYDELSNTIDKNIAKKLKDIEINIEKSYCQRNHEVFELYKFLKEHKKKIIAISDMYLTTSIVTEILANAGYEIDKVYVSCDCNAKKKNGALFKYVLEKEKLNRNEIIHFGDSYKVDILGSKIVKIKSYHVKYRNKSFNIRRFKNKLSDYNSYKNYMSIINNNLAMQRDYYSKFGFSLLGPLVYNYCNWLKEECKNKGLKKIYFFARDGYVLKNAFDKLFPNEFETNYIYFSRRAIRIPYYSINSSYGDIIQLFPKTKLIPMKVFFENFGLIPNNYENILSKYNMNLSDNIYYSELISDEKFKKIYTEIQDDIKKEANNEYDILKKYLNQENFTGKMAIVDLGWHNSMQYYLEQISSNDDNNLEMYGLYVGRQSGGKKVKMVDSFILDNLSSPYADSVASFIGLIESVFLADEGSTKNYLEKDEKVIPQLLDYEYKKEDIEYEAFDNIKKGIDDFIEIVKKLPRFNLFSLNGYDSFQPLKEYGTNPYLKDISYFSKFRYLSEEITYFANAKSIIYYLFHRDDFKKDIYKARWKVGFMKELFKISLPYYKIYEFYHKKKEK